MAVEEVVLSLVDQNFKALRQDIDDILNQLEVQRDRMRRLLHNVGEEGICKGCPARVIWVIHRNGKRTPYDPDGTNHFITCPEAERFRPPKKETHA